MMDIAENVPLSRVTSFRIGGPARYLLTLDDASELAAAAAFAAEKGIPAIPLGGGTNMLAPDDGVDAVFIALRAGSEIELASESDSSVEVHVPAGLGWDAFVEEVTSRGWWGVENLSGIPGTVGAAAVQNIGAYGVAANETIREVTAYDLLDRKPITFKNEQCAFGYRTSIFKEMRDRYFITATRFMLSRAPNPRLTYRDIAAHFSTTGEDPSLVNIRAAVLGIRSKKFPPLSDYGTAGSFFLNPVVTDDEARAMQARFPGMPLFPMPEGGVKAPLAWILDRVLALKGLRVGGAFLWEAQPLVIATDRTATARDVRALMDAVRTKVRDETGIVIVPEVRILP